MEKYDVVIIGGGPAGLTASVYASRGNLKTLFIEKGAPGGKMVRTASIENWTGDKKVTGPDLSLRMFEHAKEFGGEYKYGTVVKIDSKDENNQVITLETKETIQAKKIIIATGMVEKVPEDIENIHKFENRGVSYCAICDGPIFKGQDVAVLGGGNSAVEEASFLSSISRNVFVFVRDGLVAEQKAVEELKSKSNVTIIENSSITKLDGKDSLETVIANVSGETKEYKVSALFPYIGQTPISDFAKHLNITDKQGYINTNEEMETSTKGIYAIGDIRVKHIRQIATAASDGVIAAKTIVNKIG